MRNETTEQRGSGVNTFYHKSGMSVNEFIDAQCISCDAFDVRYLDGDGDAAYHIIADGAVATVYYVKKYDEWYYKY
jgi:hypothetical protein